MQFRRGLRDWWIGLKRVAAEARGIERVFEIVLCVLRLALPTEWVHLGFGTQERPLHSFTDAYVICVLIASAFIYSFPKVYLAWLSTYFSASTLIMLHEHPVFRVGIWGKGIGRPLTVVVRLQRSADHTDVRYLVSFGR